MSRQEAGSRKQEAGGRKQEAGKIILTFILLFFLVPFAFCLSGPALVGYWHNWNDANAPYIPLDQVDQRYNIVNVAFAIPDVGSDYKISFVPEQVSPAVFKTQVQTLQSQGRLVNISVGGANGPVVLHTAAERDTFATRLTSILNYYGFDGVDIDLEGSSLSVSGGTIYTPIDQPVINLISAIKLVMQNYRSIFQKKMYLSMAPETAFVQGGKSAYAGIWGAYLPVIQGLRDSLDILHVQLYNSGSMIGPDNNTYSQGTADFIVAMTEMVIQGFLCSGGTFFGLPATKIAIGLPACNMAAGGGYADTAIVGSAIRYLRGVGPKPGIYTLIHFGGYPDLRGMMTWSINWDATINCASIYEYASNFQQLFMNTTSIHETFADEQFTIFPNPFNESVTIHKIKHHSQSFPVEIYNNLGELIYRSWFTSTTMTIPTSDFKPGPYVFRIGENHSMQIKLSAGKQIR